MFLITVGPTFLNAPLPKGKGTSSSERSGVSLLLDKELLFVKNIVTGCGSSII